jgi:hypothetical protein
MVHHVYEGRRDGPGLMATVWKDGLPFSHYPSLLVAEYWSHGFEWGYGGHGPCQLALALLLEVCEEETAVELCQEFKWEVIARLHHSAWRIPTSLLVQWVTAHAGPMQCLKADVPE